MIPILLVEDDDNDVLLIQRAFRKAGLEAPLCVLTDGEQAIAYLKGDGPYADRERYPLPGLLILDSKLPRRSGCEVLGWLREQPGLNRLLSVVLTSSKQSADVNRAYELGVNSYLVKPVAFHALVEMLRSVCHYWLLLNERPELIAENGAPSARSA